MERTESATAQEIMPVENPSIESSYNRNLNAAMDELRKEAEVHAGELVARSTDGLVTFGYAQSYDELFALLADMDVEPHDAVIGRVPNHGEWCLF